MQVCASQDQSINEHRGKTLTQLERDEWWITVCDGLTMTEGYSAIDENVLWVENKECPE